MRDNTLTASTDKTAKRPANKTINRPGRLRVFFKEAAGAAKEFLSLPYELYKDKAKAAGLIVGAVYLSVAAATGAGAYEIAQQPQYSYTDVDHGSKTSISVNLSTGDVIQKLGPAFGKYASFKRQEICDTGFATTSASSTPVPMTFGSGAGSFTTYTPVPTEYLVTVTANCKSFNDAALNAADRQTVQKMTGYFSRAQNSFSARLFGTKME